jgi:hypothetical protein
MLIAALGLYGLLAQTVSGTQPRDRDPHGAGCDLEGRDGDW